MSAKSESLTVGLAVSLHMRPTLKDCHLTLKLDLHSAVTQLLSLILIVMAMLLMFSSSHYNRPEKIHNHRYIHNDKKLFDYRVSLFMIFGVRTMT